MVGNDIYLFLIKIYTFSTLWLNNSRYIKQQNKNGYHEKVTLYKVVRKSSYVC